MWEYSRSSRPEVFLGKGVLKICSKFSGEYQCQSSISIKLQKLVLFIHLLLSVLCYFTYICCHLLIWTKSVYLLGLYTHIYIYLLRSRYCTNVQLFSEIIKNTFFYLFCKYFAAILVASSVQVTLQFYFQIFYSIAPNKIVIRLTKLKNTNC